ncbi:MAG: cyclic nucleotide-binding domain-containing protein, partial [Deltaproteobacteria bacterium]|nr:cyclic nucleotide-binding domain-containing protein [Deltaproteobacteria bacterium]
PHMPQSEPTPAPQPRPAPSVPQPARPQPPGRPAATMQMPPPPPPAPEPEPEPEPKPRRSAAQQANLEHAPPDELSPVLELEAMEPEPQELAARSAAFADDDDDEDLDTEIPTSEQDKAEVRRLLAKSEEAEIVANTEVRNEAGVPRTPIGSDVARTKPVDMGRVAEAQAMHASQAEALEAGDDEGDSVGPIPGQIRDEWRAKRQGKGEHRISHHSAKLGIAEVIEVSAQDPGDDIPEPEVEMDIVDAVAETIPISPLLSELDSDLVKHLIENSTLRHKAPGQTVFREGDTGEQLYLILRGEVVVERRNPADGSVQRVATLRPGAFFGEMALLTDAPRSATVRAVSQLSLLDIPRDTTRYIVERQGRVRKLLMRFFRARMVGSLMVSSDLFRPFSVEDRRKLVTRFRLRELPPGQVVLEQGNRSDGLYLVLAGLVDVTSSGGNLLATLSSGEVFGEISLLEDSKTTATVRARTRGWVLRLPRDDFKELISSYPKVLERLRRLAKERKAKNAALAASSA